MKRLEGVVSLLLMFSGVLALAPAPAAAQSSCASTTTPTNRCFIRTVFFRAPIPPEVPDIVNVLADQSAEELTKFIHVALSTTPAASSSAGFSFLRNPVTGERTFKSASYGPMFADRPLTNGRGVLNVGFNYQYGRTDFEGGFDTADKRTVGLPINDETVTFQSDGFQQFITRRAFLQTKSQVFNFLVSYGLTDRLDVGVQMPIVSLALTGRQEEAWDLSRNWTPTPNRLTAIGTSVTEAATSQSARGLGDITLRSKYSLSGQVGDGVAVAVDVRVPTGNEEDLLGTGDASVRFQLLTLKGDLGPASIHGNLGYATGGLSDEFTYVGGAEFVFMNEKRLTLSASLLGRALRSGTLPTPVETVNEIRITPFGPALLHQDRFRWETKTLNLAQVAGGAKLRLSGQWLLNAGVLLPVSQRGFQPGITTVIGLDHTWVR